MFGGCCQAEVGDKRGKSRGYVGDEGGIIIGGPWEECDFSQKNPSAEV